MKKPCCPRQLRSHLWVGLVGGLLSVVVVSCGAPSATAPVAGSGRGGEAPAAKGPVLTTYEELTNSRFTPSPADPRAAVELRRIPLPDFPGTAAIWGALGRDARGHIWFGVSTIVVRPLSARLFEYDPENDTLTNRGDVLTQLKQCRKYRDGEQQMKIHSKIIQAADGQLYFASMDEEGENEDGSKLPTWGSHLWRLRRADYQWEHLLSTPEALIAVSGVGRYIYALGYFGHVLYQYDTEMGQTRSVRVGSVEGHISRNFLADHHGHVYVPRLRYTPGTPRELVITLVEFDDGLQEVAETPIPTKHYVHTNPTDSHGIIGLQYLADRSISFVTHKGFLYRITPKENGPAEVKELGWFHPKGEAYVASLATYDGHRYLCGASRREFHNEPNYEWLVFDLTTRTSTARPMTVPPIKEPLRHSWLLYGSNVRDNAGNFYLGGTYWTHSRELPELFQVRLVKPTEPRP